MSIQRPPPQQKSSCCTQVNVSNYSFEWTINNFSYSGEEMGEKVQSSMFPTVSDDNIKWCLTLFPRGSNEDNKNHLSLYLMLSSGSEVRARFKLFILNARKELKHQKESHDMLKFSHGYLGSWGFPKFIRRDFLLDKASKLLPNDKLTLYCEVSVFINSTQISTIPYKVPQCRLSEDLRRLFDEQTLTDVIFIADGMEFAAHKAILAARSPVFSAMFLHEMEEKKNNTVDITDIDHKALREMLKYIYSGEMPHLQDNMSKDLFVAADKYALDRLKVMCEEHIFSNLSVGAAAEMLILANTHNADQLKARVMDFINMHATDVMETDGWQEMIQTNPHLVAQVLKAFATQQMTPIGPPRKKVKT